jgi:hypothetical protein
MDIHASTPSQRLQSVQYSVQLNGRRTVVDDDSVYFDPRVGAKGKLLRSDNKLGGSSELSQEANERSGSLQTLDLFEVQDACRVDGGTGITWPGRRGGSPDGAIAYAAIYRVELSSNDRGLE